MVARADHARDARQWPLAADLYRTALERSPKNPPIWVQYGHALKEGGNRIEAEAAYRTAIGYDPLDADAHLQLGHVLKLQGKCSEAEAAYGRALALDRSMADAARELAALGWTEERLAEVTNGSAESRQKEATLAAGGSNGSGRDRNAKRRRESILARADRARDARQWPLAARLYCEALDRNPNNPPIWVQYGHALKESGQLVNAEAAYRRALAHDSNVADWRLQLGHVLKIQGKTGQAQTAYLRAFALDPLLGDSLFELGELGWSEVELKELSRQVMPLGRFDLGDEDVATGGPIAFCIDEFELTTTGLVTVSGWAVTDLGIQSIKILVDTIEAGEAELGRPRPDVERNHPTIATAGRSGFYFRKELGRRFSGYHRLAVIIRSTDGATRSTQILVRAVSARRHKPDRTPKIDDDQSLKLLVDSPRVVDGRVLQTIQGRLQIEGWALAREGVASIDILVDGKHLSSAKYGLRREDVGANWPDWQNSHLSGYAQVVPAQALPTGEHVVRVELRTHTGSTKAVEFCIETGEENAPWTLQRKMARSEIDLYESILSSLDWSPLFGILLTLADFDDETALDATLQSLRDQAYRRWHLVITCKNSGIEEQVSMRLASEFPDLGKHVSIAPAGEMGSLADMISRASTEKRPHLIGMLSVRDILGCDALFRMAVASGFESEVDFFYGDERRMNAISGKVEPFFKPQWSPDLLLATNYIGRFWCARLSLLERVKASVEDWHQFGEYDLVLRCTEAAHSIRHIPHLVCERGAAQLDGKMTECEALARAMKRRCIDGQIVEGCAPGYYQIQRRLRSRSLVSIIMPTGFCNVDLLTKCLSSLFERTGYQNFELVIVYNTTKPEVFPYFESISGDPRVRIIDSRGRFNFSRLCNVGAAAARGEFLLFLNDDTEVIEPDWIEGLMGHAERPEVGAVGARLLYPDGKVQHAGMFWAAGNGRHAFRFAPQTDPGYFGLAMTTRNVISVTGACIMIRRSWFEKIGRFNESHTIVNNDVDLCLRSRQHGGLVVYEPRVTLIHHELASRHDLPDEYDVGGFSDTWDQLLNTGDPYYHPNLSRNSNDYSLDNEPVRLIYAGHPLFSREDIRRILVLKLDHIGDFILAVPALQRLHRHFPEAELYLLAPPASGALTRLCAVEFKEVINFEFFNARSGLGELNLSDRDFMLLQRQLSSYHFDLAIDMRKCSDTRRVLRFTGAEWLAGYDRDGQFPWLDIALEWEGDDRLMSKRSHVSDDLCRLVDAVALATSSDRKVLHLPTVPISVQSNGRRLVCIHPGVGTETRQWPAKHFATLIDLLLKDHEVEVVLIGGSDEIETAKEVLEKVKNKSAVRSLVGGTKIADLPALLSTAALYVGNNSGPKHIAAGLGVPTVGIHSGVVDAREWGPIGPTAVAIRRDMSCSPCYLAKREQCSRDLACLTELSPNTVYNVCKQLLQTSLRK
jgi:O-antigen biosynthesis protein